MSETSGKTTRRIRRVDETLRESRRRRTTHSRHLRATADGAEIDDHRGGGGASGRWRYAVLAVVVLALSGVALSTLRAPSTPPASSLAPVATAEVVRGSVLSSTPGATRLLPLARDGVLRAGDVVETRPRATAATTEEGSADEQGGRVALRLAGGPSLRLDEGSRAQLVSETVVVLDRGGVYVDAREAGSSIEVRTTLGVVRDIGTQFEVRLIETGAVALRVRVREGEVLLEHAGVSHHAGLGEQLLLRTDGSVERREIPPWGNGWDWVLGMAPVPAFEGRTLAQFVEWLAREGGWTLRWEDRRLAELAETVALAGSSRGLTPLEALEVVMSGTTDFSHSIDETRGELRVTRRR